MNEPLDIRQKDPRIPTKSEQILTLQAIILSTICYVAHLFCSSFQLAILTELSRPERSGSGGASSRMASTNVRPSILQHEHFQLRVSHPSPDF